LLTFPRPTCDIGTSGAGEIFLVTRLCKRWLGLIKLLVLLDVTLVLSNDAAAQDSLYDDGVLSSIAKLDGDEIPLYLEVSLLSSVLIRSMEACLHDAQS
jgi:hypothetical protein